MDVDPDEVGVFSAGSLDDVETASTPVEDDCSEGDDVHCSVLVVEGSVKGLWLLEVVGATAEAALVVVEELAPSVVDDSVVDPSIEVNVASVEVDVASTAAALVVVVVG